MKFRGINSSFCEEFPHIMEYLNLLEPTVNRDGCEIVIEDMDRRYESIRLGVESLTGNNELTCQYEKQITDYLSTHCCICGSTKPVKTMDGYIINATICQDCTDILSIRGVEIKGPELTLIPLLKQGRPTPHIKCRLKANDGHLFYKFSEDLSYRDGQFIVVEKDKVEPVILSGIYTGIRDWKGVRIYTGDIILAEDNYGEKFWGMIMHGNKWGKSERDISLQWDNFCLTHGLDSFPSALRWAKKIEIVGNVVSDVQYTGPIPTPDDYENYYYNHNLNTKQYKFSDE